MFDKGTGTSGYDWVILFLRRSPDLTVRLSEGVSVARGMVMNRTEVKSFFNLLGKVMKEDGFFNQPGRIFNVW
jgi:hypothetical protein